MTTAEIIALVASLISVAVGISTLITFITKRQQIHHDEGAKEATINASLDVIKLQNESLLQSNRNIVDKLDGQNVRLSRIEQTIKDSRLSEIPRQIAALESSVKSAHHRIDEINKKQ